jgi:hypothetical protein
VFGRLLSCFPPPWSSSLHTLVGETIDKDESLHYQHPH